MKSYRWYRVVVAMFCLTSLLALFAGRVHAGPARQGESDFVAVDAYVSEQVQKRNIPGLALGIVQDGQVAHLQTFGSADASGRPVTAQTPFYLASLTKSFTALAVMQLVEAGRVDLDAPVRDYLPWFALADEEASAGITVRSLLNHNSGISRQDGDRDWTVAQNPAEMASELTSVELAHPVGATYEYSNLNYIIAGWIVEQVSGQPYGDYVREHIFAPLDMRHTYAARADALEDGLAEGHYYMFAYPFAAPAEARFGLASGGLIASVEDMAHYALAHLNGGRYGETSVLSPQGMAELHAPAVPAGTDQYYGMGWGVATLDGTDVLRHSGALTNFRTSMLLLPATGSAVILLANANGFEQILQIDELANQVAGMLAGRTPAAVTLPLHFRFLYWALLLTPIAMLAGIAYGRRHWRDKGRRYSILTAVLFGGVALLWLFAVPQLTGFPIWPDMYRGYPEMFFALVAGVVIGIGWSVLYAVMNWRRAP